MHRYRLFVFGNFFTSRGSVDDMAETLGEVLADANLDFLVTRGFRVGTGE